MEKQRQRQCCSCGVLCPTSTNHNPQWDAATHLGSLHLGSNNLQCRLVLGCHDQEAIFPFYRAHSAEWLHGLVPGQAENPEAGSGIAPAPPSSIPNPLCIPVSQCSSSPSPAVVGRGMWGCSSLSIVAPAYLEPRAIQTVAASATPSNQLHLWGKGTWQGAAAGKCLSVVRE